jgi:hypothetical protein
MLFLGDVLGLAVSAREAIVSHLEACVGTTPPPNGASLAAAIHSLDVTPASHLWDAAVAEMLRIHFDSDGSGRIDRDLEVLDIPCEVFVALEEAVSTTTNAPFSAVYGFAYGFEWVGASLGFSETVREETRRALDQCQLP